MKVRAGVDIGGTKVRIGLVGEEGELLLLVDKIAMSKFEHGDELMLVIANTIKAQIAEQSDYELIGVGVGAPGPLNDTHESVMETPNTPIIQNYPLVARLQAHFDVPVKMNNDANVFVLGEAISGAGKGEGLVYGITLGTGYGHGFVWEGRILSGAHGTATEYGLAPYNDGTFEDYASGPALERNYESISGESRTGLQIFKLARDGNANALAAWSLLGRSVGHSLVYVNYLLDPGIIVIGGSLATGFEFFIDSLREVVDAHLFENQKGRLRIERAELGDAAPIIGSALLIS
ncbi:MAG: ROK family protein [Candidatus Marinimicrobia bacterium]|jgi:predicted NBD/HSP70 family sugar kinase|nr:ROK family protein [Candidatus Neomarinimicrobiota bacterium]MBT4361703.1 ROK family protein [Candidatus Neomarinimicrobiota bacterium]MBT4715149.1 ROK family protein [Candidatus Neomarinimicrobiota bacterium]MBT4947921.1 ROK family protein [Candidatus Neomarinimicrobiota bacterium]MBT5268509.1 ROK family protein [Candidatus Neomarinimicrobiota bacterium]